MILLVLFMNGVCVPAIASSVGMESIFPLVSDQNHRINQKLFLSSVKKKEKEREKKSTKKGKEENDLSQKEKDVLYKVVSMECDTGYEGSLAVISCMLNRKDSKKYPDDLMEVVREKSQFTAYYDKRSKTYPYKDRIPSEECQKAVDDALEHGKRNLPSYIYYFRSSDYTSLDGYETYKTIGDNTYFYLEEDVK